MKLPKEIVIADGRLKMADGSSLRKCLIKWQDGNPKLLPNGSFVNIIEHSKLQELIEDANLARNWGS